MKLAVMLRYLSAVMLGVTSLAFAQQSPNLSSLERFDSSLTMDVLSELDVRNIHIGDNVQVEANALVELGAKLRHVSGGNRSDDVEFTFSQPYQTSQLVQTLALHFDKDLGLIHQINLTYRIASRYVDILPIYLKTVAQAAAKYGEPLSFEQVQTISAANIDKPRLSDFIENLSVRADVAEDVVSFFKDKQITSRTHFVKSEKGRALLLSGFRQCYFWQKSDFTEILSLCSFQPSSGNMKGQGVTLSLVNFDVAKAIEQFQLNQSEVDINF